MLDSFLIIINLLLSRIKNFVYKILHQYVFVRIKYFENYYQSAQHQRMLQDSDGSDNVKSGSGSSSPNELFVFRPFQLTKIGCNSDKNGNIVPAARSGHRIVCNDGNMFCFGGFNPDYQRQGRQFLFHELWKFNRHREQWSLVLDSQTSMPRQLASNAVILEGEILMIFGGTGFPFGETSSNRLSLCCLNQDPITIKRVKTKGDRPDRIYGHTILCQDKYLYVVGGTTGFIYFCDIHRLDLETREWECVYLNRDENPRGRYRHGIAFDGNLIYVLGGGTAMESYELIEVPAFDIKNKCWKFIKTLPDESQYESIPAGYPSARKCHSCIQYKNVNNDVHVVIAGGYDDNVHYDDIWCLNLTTHRWRLVTTAKLPKPLFFHDAATSGDGCMYIFGGIMFEENNVHKRVNDIYKIWMKIPSLSAICWEAVLHYYPNVKNFEKDKLLEAGIPKSFVSALHS